jgi:hypothetical protein
LENASKILIAKLKPDNIMAQTLVDQILGKLLEGSTKDACYLAVSGGLWSIALILGNRIGEEVYSDVVLQFSTNWFDHSASAVMPNSRNYSLQILLVMMGGSDPVPSNNFLT